MEKIGNMSSHALSVFEDAVESLLRRNYELADKVADKALAVRSIENEAVEVLERSHQDSVGNYKLILEDIRRTAEYSSDIGEAAMNQTVNEVIAA
jgi:phosphate uptake regulator